MSDARTAPPYLFLELDHETVTAIEGPALELVPPVLAGAAGAGLLDFVHPVDRPTIALWLTEGFGTSPPFRRAAADDPPRWFRFIAADVAPGKKGGRILLVEISDEIRQDTLRKRLDSVLARYVGAPLIDRAPELAAELAGAAYGCLAELYPPVAIVRSSYGRGMPATGTTLPIRGTPTADVAGAKTIRVFPEGVSKLYPEWPVVRLVGAESAIVIPIVDPLTAETRAVVTCCSTRPLHLTSGQEELIDLLAMRLASELGARDTASKEPAPLPDDGASLSDDTFVGLLTTMMFDGVIHTLNNLFASQMLHLDLVLSDLPAEGAVAEHLQRVAAEAARGASIVNGLGELAHGQTGEWVIVQLDRLIERAVDRVTTIHAALEVRLEKRTPGLTVWVDRHTFLRLLAGLLETCATMAGEAGYVRASTGWEAEGSKRLATITILADSGTGGSETAAALARTAERFQLWLVIARKVAGGFGGHVSLEQEAHRVRITLTLPALPDENQPPEEAARTALDR